MKNESLDDLLDWVDMNFVPKRTKMYFLANNYVPNNEYEANAFIFSKAQVDLDRKIEVNFYDDKKIENVTIGKENFYLGFYPKIWQKLSVEDKVFVVYYAYKKLKDEFRIDKLNFRLVSQNLAKNGYGVYESIDNDLCINFDKLISKSAYNGLVIYDSIAHEMNHANQELIKKYIIKHGATSAENYYQKSLLFKNHNIDFDIQANKFIDDEHKRRLAESKADENWNGFVSTFYYGSYREISSGNVQVKYFKKIAEQTYSHFKKDYRKDKKLIEVLQKEDFSYSIDRTNLYFANCIEMANNINVLLGEYKTHFDTYVSDLNQTDNLLAKVEKAYKEKLVEMPKQSGNPCVIDQINMISTERINLQRKRNKLLKRINCLAKKQKMCYEALIDLFYFYEKPENFNEKIYEDIDYYINKKKENYELIENIKNL